MRDRNRLTPKPYEDLFIGLDHVGGSPTGPEKNARPARGAADAAGRASAAGMEGGHRPSELCGPQHKSWTNGR